MTELLAAITGPYVVCSPNDFAGDVARQLTATKAAFLVIHDVHRSHLRVVAVTPDLIFRLVVRPVLSVLPAETIAMAVRDAPALFDDLTRADTYYPVSRSNEPPQDVAALFDRAAAIVGADEPVSPVVNITKSAQPPVEIELYPTLTASAGTVEPDQVIEIEIALDSTAPLGQSTALPISFGSDETSVTLQATVSSSQFKPEGAWTHAFEVTRVLGQALRWTFKARATGDFSTYTVTVRFFRSGELVGNASLTLTRARPHLTLGPDRNTGQLRPLSRAPQPVPATLDITELGGDAFGITMYRNGRKVDEATWVARDMAAYADKLEQARSLDDAREQGAALLTDLPGAVQSFLDAPDEAGIALKIVSSAPVAPFELVQLRAAQNGPLLGVERPVARAFDTPVKDVTDVAVKDVLCIRPDYPTQPLPEAALEEDYLRTRYPALSAIRTKAELAQAIASSSARLVHFAGHADGNPAQLFLEDGPITPSKFAAGQALMRSRPVFFVNGCRAGYGKPGAPAGQANMAKILLAAQAAAVVAPLIKTQSPAAREAARIFYDAIADGKTVIEAVRAIRERALKAQGDHVASYLSYLAFAPPTLRFTPG